MEINNYGSKNRCFEQILNSQNFSYFFSLKSFFRLLCKIFALPPSTPLCAHRPPPAGTRPGQRRSPRAHTARACPCQRPVRGHLIIYESLYIYKAAALAACVYIGE